MLPTTPDLGALVTAAARPLLLLVLVAACGAGASRGATPRSTTTTTSDTSRYGADAVDGQNRAPAGAATAWTTEGGPASPGMPSTGEILEAPDEPSVRDAGR